MSREFIDQQAYCAKRLTRLSTMCGSDEDKIVLVINMCESEELLGRSIENLNTRKWETTESC